MRAKKQATDPATVHPLGLVEAKMNTSIGTLETSNAVTIAGRAGGRRPARSRRSAGTTTSTPARRIMATDRSDVRPTSRLITA